MIATGARVEAIDAGGKSLWVDMPGSEIGGLHMTGPNRYLCRPTGGLSAFAERDLAGKWSWVFTPKWADPNTGYSRSAISLMPDKDGDRVLYSTEVGLVEVDRRNEPRVVYTFPGYSKSPREVVGRAARDPKGAFVLLTSDGRVRFINSKGEETGGFIVQHEEQGMAVRPDGTVVLTSWGRGRVGVFDREGTELWAVSVWTPVDCRCLKNGGVLVGSVIDRVVLEFDADGTEVWRHKTARDVTSVFRVE